MSILFFMPAKEPPKKIDGGDDAAVVEKTEVDKPDAVAAAAGDESVIADTAAEPAFVTLGSLDTASPYRMLVTLNNRGAAVNRIELSDERYRDVQDLSGYLGQIVVDCGALSASVKGCPVQVVGDGTPAANAGLQRGDLITTIAFYDGDKVGRSVPIGSFEDLRVALGDSRPKQRIKIQFKRNGKTNETDAVLSNAPISVLRPEVTPSTYEEYVRLGGLRGYDPGTSDQLSFLTTINAVAEVKNAKLAMPATFAHKADRKHDIERDETLALELDAVTLRDGNWELVSADNEHASFSKTVPRFNLRMTKTYRIAKIAGDANVNAAKSGAYHLTLTVTIENLGNVEQTVSYQLDGPTGAPLEGAWYSQKSGPGWGSYGIRDVVVNLPSAGPEIISNNVVAFDAVPETWKDETPKYVGVDSKFFQCSLLPVLKDDASGWVSRLFPIRVGKTQVKWTVLTNNSFRLISKPVTLSAANNDDKVGEVTNG
ncbi:MAG: PDZ domain-containing protein, partial [Planctomycetaceae bacterium]|nr:PDZ domain-containing protein [Planctomycetaceae bacterium]